MSLPPIRSLIASVRSCLGPVYDFFDGFKSIISVIEGDCIPDQLVPFLLKLTRQGKFDFGQLCKRYSYKDADQAVKDMVSGAVIKPIRTSTSLASRRPALTGCAVVWD